MTPEELDDIQNTHVPVPTIDIDSFVDRSDRTLLVGYHGQSSENGAAHTLHVYIRDEKVHVHRYTTERTIHHFVGQVPLEACVPTKRVFPERTDAAFAEMLIFAGAALSFTHYDDEFVAAATFADKDLPPGLGAKIREHRCPDLPFLGRLAR